MKKLVLLYLLSILCFNIFARSNNEEGEIHETKQVSFNFNEEVRSIKIPTDPQRVVVIGFDTLDIIDSLGYKDRVVGVVDPNGPMFPKYLKGYENVQSIGALWGDDFEGIAALKPDLIIASARTYKSFESLSEIAPSIYFPIPGMGTPFKEELFNNIDILANVFSNSEKGDNFKKEIDEKISEVRVRVGAIVDPSALFLIITGKTIGLYSDNIKSRYGFVFSEFGFTSPTSMAEIKDDSAQHGNSVSYEFISAKNPNYMLIIDRGRATGETDVTAHDTLDNEIVAQTSAYKNDNLLYLDATSWYISNGGVQSTFNMLDDLLSQLK